jgi:uncharacterized protein
MPTRDSAPVGAPCWADLFSSDVEGSRRFYSELFGWEPQEPSAEFGGYFTFTRDGVEIAGCMGDMGDIPATNTWNVYLATDDINKTVEATAAENGQVVAPPMDVADLGTQAMLNDPTGAHLGAWQAATFPGFTVIGEPGAPSWFELSTRDYTAALDFYRSVFGWDTAVVADNDEMRYSVMRDHQGEGEWAGIMDAAGFLGEGVPSHWSVYWEVEDVDAAIGKVKALGGSVVMDAEDTPYGRLATVTDPAGAEFKLRTG